MILFDFFDDTYKNRSKICKHFYITHWPLNESLIRDLIISQMPRSPSRSGSATPPRRARAPSPQRSQNKSPSPPRQEPEPAQQEPQQEPKLFITSLANEVTEDDLRSTFEPHGNIVNIFVKENERGKFAFVTYDTME